MYTMPHIIVEHSANVADHHDIDALVEVVHQAALEIKIGALAGMRTRAAPRLHFRVADGGSDLAFIAIVVRVGPGRDPATKRSWLDHVLDRAQGHISDEGSNLAIAWSIEVQEIDADYRINRNEVPDRLRQRPTA